MKEVGGQHWEDHNSLLTQNGKSLGATPNWEHFTNPPLRPTHWFQQFQNFSHLEESAPSWWQNSQHQPVVWHEREQMRAWNASLEMQTGKVVSSSHAETLPLQWSVIPTAMLQLWAQETTSKSARLPARPILVTEKELHLRIPLFLRLPIWEAGKRFFFPHEHIFFFSSLVYTTALLLELEMERRCLLSYAVPEVWLLMSVRVGD